MMEHVKREKKRQAHIARVLAMDFVALHEYLSAMPEYKLAAEGLFRGQVSGRDLCRVARDKSAFCEIMKTEFGMPYGQRTIVLNLANYLIAE